MDLLKAGSLAKKKGGGATNVEDVFSTFLYEGNSTTQVIANEIDLAGEGGLLWLKWRSGSNAFGHALYDSERGVTKELKSQTAGAESTENRISSFNSNGFTLTGNTETNYSGDKYVSWTFRKAPKFFDIVTYTGNGTTQNIAHSLESTPGMIIVKNRTSATSWSVWHRSVNSGAAYGVLNLTDAFYTDSSGTAIVWGDNSAYVAPTSTQFTVGSNSRGNTSGNEYVAYIFADNSAEDAEEQMIKCGSCVINSADAVVDLGWQPQFVLIKEYNVAGSWKMVDTMRGMGVDPIANQDRVLLANSSNLEETNNGPVLTPSGFAFPYAGGNAAANGSAYIYMAVRGPMMVEPKAATDVFAVDTRGSTGDGKKPGVRSGFPVDMALRRQGFSGSSAGYLDNRMTQGQQLETSSTLSEQVNTKTTFDFNNGYYEYASTYADQLGHMWKRAKGYFDIVAYTGNATPSVGHRLNVPHALGVAPEMLIHKRRDSTSSWQVLHKDAGGGYLENTSAFYTSANGATVDMADYVTSTTFSIGNWVQAWHNNTSGSGYVVYLFATLAGISKVGSYTGNGSSQTINCGFAAGSRFILIKRTDSTGDWYVWDSLRGIVAGNDPHLSLNTTAAQVTSDDSVDPQSSGFIVNQVSATNINVTSATYIFYAIA